MADSLIPTMIQIELSKILLQWMNITAVSHEHHRRGKPGVFVSLLCEQQAFCLGFFKHLNFLRKALWKLSKQKKGTCVSKLAHQEKETICMGYSK